MSGEKTETVEITPAMTMAGISAFISVEDEACSRAVLVEAVYRAMAEARIVHDRRSPPENS